MARSVRLGNNLRYWRPAGSFQKFTTIQKRSHPHAMKARPGPTAIAHRLVRRERNQEQLGQQHVPGDHSAQEHGIHGIPAREQRRRNLHSAPARCSHRYMAPITGARASTEAGLRPEWRVMAADAAAGHQAAHPKKNQPGPSPCRSKWRPHEIGRKNALVPPAPASEESKLTTEWTDTRESGWPQKAGWPFHRRATGPRHYQRSQPSIRRLKCPAQQSRSSAKSAPARCTSTTGKREIPVLTAMTSHIRSHVRPDAAHLRQGGHPRHPDAPPYHGKRRQRRPPRTGSSVPPAVIRLLHDWRVSGTAP